MSNKEIQTKVRTIFKEFLEKNRLRKTEERFNILDEIYSLDEHFDAESLFNHFKKKGMNVSRATVYNTITILLKCSLIKRHQFEKKSARFEKSYSFKQHDHLICSDCNHVFEFCDPRIQQIQNVMGDIFNFNVTHHALQLFGKCREFSETGACKNRKSA